MGELVNAWLDRLPRTRFFAADGTVPAFRSCGVAGFHAGLVTCFAAALLTGRSLLITTMLCVVAALSFFAWALLRKRITGREVLVLLEHVWIAQAAIVASLYALGRPILAYWDVLSLGLCVFLAAGRTGC